MGSEIQESSHFVIEDKGNKALEKFLKPFKTKIIMRTLLKFQLDVEAANKAMRDGSFPKIMEKLMHLTKPEASYFGTEDGNRTGYIFFDLKDPSFIPQIGELLFMGANAKITLSPIMNQEDLQKGLTAAFAKDTTTAAATA
jgi:hypothetical protein